MTDIPSYDAIEAYLTSHPLIAIILAILVLSFLFSLMRLLVRAAFVLFVVLCIGLYWTHNEASVEWHIRAQELGAKAAEYGKEAWRAGTEIIEENSKSFQGTSSD
ncbi:MAG: hypothetical protein VX294_14235 [Candidatus Latescibacterota bacterium]|nr:hypothetical protein [Candidatus Latescibacterota bacterium]